MRRKIFAGNWKMNGSMSSVEQFIKEFHEYRSSVPNDPSQNQVVLALPYTLLSFAQKLLREEGGGGHISLAAQNVHDQPSGAFTGEVSASMLQEMGVEYVIVGHSERRQYMAESHEFICKKVKACLEHGLKPILCVGEALQDRESGRYKAIINDQLRGVFDSVPDLSAVIIAYEPVWAIGTGLAASPSQAQEVHRYIRDLLVQHRNQKVAETMCILYGGSMKPDNAQQLFACPDIDGGLIGGASLKADSFIQIMQAAGSPNPH